MEDGIKILFPDGDSRVFDLTDPDDLDEAMRELCRRNDRDVSVAFMCALLLRVQTLERRCHRHNPLATEHQTASENDYFGVNGPAGKAAKAAEKATESLPEVEARLEGITVGQMVLYGIRGAYLYHRALAEQEELVDEMQDIYGNRTPVRPRNQEKKAAHERDDPNTCHEHA